MIAATTGEDLLVRESVNNPGRVELLVDGLPDASLGAVQASQVQKLVILGGSGENVIDVSGVLSTAFTFVDPVGNGMRIDVDGGNGHDVIIGSPDFANNLAGGDGNDAISGQGGDDTLSGGDGNDTVNAGGGNDSIVAGDGNDSVTGDDGQDSIDAGDGADTVNGGAGDDQVLGSDGDDRLSGDTGNDTLDGQNGRDTLDGSDGDDVLAGGSGNDSIDGGLGNDTLAGQSGNDFMECGRGDDNAGGGSGNDILLGNAGADTLNGQAGNDRVFGDSGNDIGFGGDGNDEINGATGDDSLYGGTGNDSVCGGGGADSLDGQSGNDEVDSACEELVTVSIDSVTISPEGNSGTQAAVFTLTLSGPSEFAVFVDYRTLDGTAVDGIGANETADYQPSLPGSTVVFAPGQLTQTISIDVFGDTIDETDVENYFVELVFAERATIGTRFGECVIDDDDTTPLPLVDVFLLFDDTNSFQPFLGALGPLFDPTNPSSVVNTLAAQLPAFSIGYGLGRFEDFGGGNNPFVLNHPIILPSTPGFATALSAAFRRSSPGGGSGSGLSTFIEALYQTATGIGFDGNGDGSTLGSGPAGSLPTQTQNQPSGDVPPFSSYSPDPNAQELPAAGTLGGAGFRAIPAVPNAPEPIRIVLVGADAPNRFNPAEDMNSPYDGLSGTVSVPAASLQVGGLFNAPANAALGQDTVNALNALGIRVIGLGAGGPFGDGIMTSSVPRAPLEALAVLTGALNQTGAPIENGITPTIDSTDIQPNDPLYFLISQSNSQTIANGIVQAVISSIPKPEMSIDLQVVPEGNLATTTVDFTVSLTAAPLQDVTVDFSFMDGSAMNGVDYIGTGGTLTFAAQSGTSTGETQKTIAVQILGDTVFEPDKSFSVTLSNVSISAVIANGTGVGTILNDDVPLDVGDTFAGGDGNDTLIGAEGNDLFSGDLGNDAVFGNDGTDSLYGGGGRDTLSGGNGDDSLTGNGGSDLLVNDDGEDTFVWRGIIDGSDSLGSDGTAANPGFDRLEVRLSDASETLAITQDGRTLQFTVGIAVLSVTSGSSELGAGVEQITVNARGGNDSITLGHIDSVGSASLTIRGETGNDVISAADARMGHIRLRIDGGEGADLVTGSASADTVDGGAGNDVVLGGGSNDSLLGSAGDDVLDGEAGDDILEGLEGADSLLGNVGNDFLNGGTGNDSLDGGDGRDSLLGDFGDDVLNGNAGNDSLHGGNGRDTLLGAAGNDTLNGGRNNDVVIGHAGHDRVLGDHGNDFLRGNAGNDTLNGGDGDDTILGEDGHDGIIAGDGHDFVSGDAGNDTILGGDGNDSLLGGGGVDIVLGEDGNDILTGNSGTDTLAGGQGSNAISDSTAQIDETFRLPAALLTALNAVA